MRFSLLISVPAVSLLAACTQPTSQPSQAAAAPHTYQDPAIGSMIGGADGGGGIVTRDDTSIGQHTGAGGSH